MQWQNTRVLENVSVPAGKPQGCLKADAYNVNITLHAGLLHRMLMVNVFRENQFQRFHFQ